MPKVKTVNLKEGMRVELYFPATGRGGKNINGTIIKSYRHHFAVLTDAGYRTSVSYRDLAVGHIVLRKVEDEEPGGNYDDHRPNKKFKPLTDIAFNSRLIVKRYGSSLSDRGNGDEFGGGFTKLSRGVSS